MQFGKQRSVDPEDFITTLRINTALQQDAHVSFLVNLDCVIIIDINKIKLYCISGVFKFVPISLGKQV